MQKKLIWASVSLVLLIIVLIWIQGGFHSKVKPGRTVSQQEVASSKTFIAEEFSGTASVSVSGTVVPKDIARVASRTLGYVIELNAYEGDKVEKDQLLIRIDTKEASEKLEQAKAGLESARAEAIKTKNDYSRYKSLYEKDSVSKKDLDDVTAKYEIAKAAETRAEAAVEEAQTMLSYGNITAPYDGIVSERNVNIGDLATPGKPLLSIYTPGSLEMIASVGEQYADVVQPGKSVQVSVPSANYVRETQIREVVPQRDEKTRTITVKAPLPDGSGINPGGYGTLSFQTKQTESIVVPITALKNIGQLETIIVEEDGKSVVRQVKTGKKVNNNLVEILSGIKAGEKIIIP